MKTKNFLMAAALTLVWLNPVAEGPIVQMWTWVISGAALAGWCICQSWKVWRLSLLFAAGLTLSIGLLQYFDLAAGFWPWLAEAPPGQMLGNLRQRNQFASLMAIGFLSLFAMLASQQSGNVKSGAFNVLDASTTSREITDSKKMMLGPRPLILVMACCMLALLGLGSAMSGSRTGLLQWISVAGLVLVWRVRCREVQISLLCAAVGSYGLGILVTPSLSNLLEHGNAGLLGRLGDANAFSRLVLWRNVVELISQEPLLGHGWRSLAYAHYSAVFADGRFLEILDNAHNLPLHLAVELGLPVAVAFCGLVAWLIWKNKPWNETQPDRQMAWGILLVIGIHSMLEYPLWYGPFFMTTVLCIGILCADLWKKWLVAGSKSREFAIILGVRSLGVALLAFTAFVAFDYHRVSQIYLQPEERSSWYADDALGAAKKSVLFKSHAKFAELVITPLSRETAPRVLELSSELVHWSPEPRVIEALIESAVMMGVDDVAAFHLQRYRVAYPKAYADWKARMGQQPS